MAQPAKPGVYASHPMFADVTPIPQDDGPHPLAQIAYSDDYREAMSYLRALMVGEGEKSERALYLTADMIALNPAHYTVWSYRADILFALNSDLAEELVFIDIIAEDNPKNYQVFHHRQRIVEAMAKRGISDFNRELKFTEDLILADNKNYHVWSYRQWLVKHFDLPPTLEVAFTTRLIEEDILNNSAWSHRYYTLFGHGAGEETLKKGDQIVDSELEFTEGIIRRMPSNPAPWNYLRGVLKYAKRPLSSIESFASEFVPAREGAGEESVEGAAISVHAMDILAEINAQKNPQLAEEYMLALAGKYDTMRKGYWAYRIEKLGQPIAT